MGNPLSERNNEYMLSVVSKVVIYFLVTSICIENMRLINNGWATIDPPTIDPPTIDPPTIDPPTIDPPTIDPPTT